MYEHYQGSSAEYCFFRSFGKLSQLLKCESVFIAYSCKTGSFFAPSNVFLRHPLLFCLYCSVKVGNQFVLWRHQVETCHRHIISLPWWMAQYRQILERPLQFLVILLFYFNIPSSSISMINIQAYGIRDPRPPAKLINMRKLA